MRYEFPYKEDDYIIINIAEITKNKNQIMLIRALPNLKRYIPNIKILFVGNDSYSNYRLKIEKLVKKLQVQDIVQILGYRHDIDKLIAISDISFSASIREGLPVNIIEAMACGTAIVCSKNRGHNSLIIDGVSGMFFSNIAEMVQCILTIYKSKDFAETLGRNAIQYSKKYSHELILEKMSAIYLSP